MNPRATVKNANSAPERGPPSPQHSASTYCSSRPSRLHSYLLSSSVLRRMMTAMTFQTGRRYSRDRISKMHRVPNASLLSPSRTRSVSSTFGERSGEGPSKPFKCCSFLTPQASGNFPALRKTPAPKVRPIAAKRVSQPVLRSSQSEGGSLSEATLGMSDNPVSKPSAPHHHAVFQQRLQRAPPHASHAGIHLHHPSISHL